MKVITENENETIYETPFFFNVYCVKTGKQKDGLPWWNICVESKKPDRKSGHIIVARVWGSHEYAKRFCRQFIIDELVSGKHFLDEALNDGTIVAQVTDIEWDIDDEDTADLPDTVTLPKEIDPNDDDAVGDYLSDAYGFCHYGFRIVFAEADF